MTADLVYHFPPDVFEALVDAIPLITRGRKTVLTFFRGCGVDRDLLARLAARMDADDAFGKYPATREVLTHLNDRGEVELATRREVVRRVAEFDQFFSCYKDNQLKAQGAVATVAQLVNRKDSFTRMQMAHEAEQRRRREDMEAVAEARRAHQRALSQVRDDLFRLFGEQDAHKRGKSLEGVLARLFEVSGILVRDPFIVSEGGPIEQIDGAVELDGRLYLVEMKWCSEPLGRGEVAPHLVSVWGRAGAGGIFISASGFTDSAIADFKTALADRTVVLVELREVVRALDVGFPLADLLKAKVQEATLTKRPLTYPLEERS